MQKKKKNKVLIIKKHKTFITITKLQFRNCSSKKVKKNKLTKKCILHCFSKLIPTFLVNSQQA